jgi:hypothetical protein
MRVVTGKVVGGKVIVEGTPLDEGSIVTIVARDSDETFELTPAEEAALVASIEEAERGDVVPGDAVISRLRPRK